MSIINSNQLGSGTAGTRGDDSPVASGILFNVALQAWSLGKGRVLLDDVCCDNYITASGIDSSSIIHYSSAGYCERLYTASGISSSLQPTLDNFFTSSGVTVSNNILVPLYSNEISNTVTEISTSIHPSARENSMMAYSLEDRALFLFGGNDGARKSDLWKYDIESSVWTNITPMGASPVGRDNHTLIYNNQSRSLVLFGGQTASGLVNDTWSYSIVGGTWQLLTPSGNGPGVRHSHSAIYDPVGNQMLVWGGLYNATNYKETFQLSFVNNYWANLADTGNPVARNDHWAAYDSHTRSMLIYGGTAGTTLYGDFWLYAIESNTWVQRHTSNVTMWGHTLTNDPIDRCLIIIGGQSSTGEFTSDILVYNFDTNSFYNTTTPYQFFLNSATAWDTFNNQLYVFGGRDSVAGLRGTFIKYTFREINYDKDIMVTHTTNASHFLTKSWTHLDSIRIDQGCKGLTKLDYAFSFDQRSTWKIYTTVSGWSSIAQNNNGNWQYLDANQVWVNSPDNTSEGALKDAFVVTSNAWNWLDSDLSRQEFSVVPTMYSNTNPAPFSASASSIYNTSYDAWYAFGGTNPWYNSGSSANQWVQIDTKSPFIPYAWRWRTSNTTYAPKRFKLQGYRSQGGTWDDLDSTYAGSDYPQMAAGIFTPWFPLTTVSGYSVYRMFINSGYSATYVYIDQLEISQRQVRPSLLGRSAWEATGGFIPTVTKSIDVAVGFKIVDHIPSVTRFTANYMTSDSEMTLISEPWVTFTINPTSIELIVKCKFVDTVSLGTDVKVWVSSDDGANYEQITNLQILSTVDNYSYIVGRKSGLVPRNSNIMRLKITTSNFKNIQIYGTCLGVDYV
jgi:hypothetical protein